MNITKEQWISIAKIVLAAILAIAAIFGYDLGVIQPREQALGNAVVVAVKPPVPLATLGPDSVQRYSTIQTNQLRVNNTEEHLGTETHSGASSFTGGVTANTLTTTLLVSQSVEFSGNATGAYFTGTVSMRAQDATVVNGLAAKYITSTNVISMSGATFTGPIKYGSASNVISGTTIAHGMGTTPTWCALTPSGHVTATYNVGALGAVSVTVYSLVEQNPPAVTMLWTCGK